MSDTMVYVRWIYLHSLNSKSKLWRTKTGVFYRLVHHQSSYIRSGKPQLAVVHFKGNKRSSRVPERDLKFVDKESCLKETGNSLICKDARYFNTASQNRRGQIGCVCEVG